MHKSKIERLFVDFILNEVGPNKEKEKERNTKYNLAKQIIENALIMNYPNYIPHIFIYGSFSIKTYLKDSDIDITIILENKENHELLKDISNILINDILQIIQKAFEEYNIKIKSNTFNDITIILSDIKLLKCQIDSIFLDISLNNFYGLLKIIFMNYIFEKLGKDDNKLIILRRTITLIKAWFYYEGNFIGSNIGLMASCALELLVLYIFNIYYENIQDEIDAFFLFFKLMSEFDFENNIITIFGPISKNYFFENCNQKEPFWYVNKTENKYLFNIEEFKIFMKQIEKSKNVLYPNEPKKNMFQNKLFNILDPINNSNNLGKSINYHCFSKMKGAFKYMMKEINKIYKIKQICDPFLYINSLLKLFNTCLSMNFIELFINYLNIPKINIIPKNKECYSHNILKVDKNEIIKFNKLFNFSENNKKEEKKEKEEEEEEDDDNEDIINIEEIKGIKNMNVKYQKFDIIINNKIMNKLQEINNDYNEQYTFYGDLNKISEQNFEELNNFMKNFKII